MAERNEDPGTSVRQLMRRVPRVALGTIDRDSGRPYVSLAMVALAHDATPLLLLSDLADHTKNLKSDAWVSLLFDGTGASAVPLAGPRASVQGEALPSQSPDLAARYVARHSDAADYLSFKDFNLYLVKVERAHLVAGFGRIHWVDRESILLDTSGCDELAAAEAGIVEHMNEDHRDAVQLYATALLGRSGDGWILTGVDPEGADLRRDSETVRLAFERKVDGPEAARAEFVRLVKRARSSLGEG
jgi:heme iron utilization protein